MAVRFRRVSIRPEEEEGLDAAALAFIQFSRAIVNRDARALLEAVGVERLPGGCRAVARDPRGQHTLIASSTLADIHAEEAMLDLMRRCRWGDFKYMYVEVEPCHEGAFSRAEGAGCRDKLAAALPSSQGVVFYTLPQQRGRGRTGGPAPRLIG